MPLKSPFLEIVLDVFFERFDFFAKMNPVWEPLSAIRKGLSTLQSNPTSIPHGPCLRTCRTECFEAISVARCHLRAPDMSNGITFCYSYSNIPLSKVPRPRMDRRLNVHTTDCFEAIPVCSHLDI